MDKNKYYCRINGVINNLSDIQNILNQDALDGKFDRNIILMMHEDHGMEFLDALVFLDVLKFNNYQIPSDYNQALEKMQAYNQASLTPPPHCPKCGSTDIRTWAKPPWKKCNTCDNLWI